MAITKIKDYTKPDGSIDWISFRKAEINNGERCYVCDAMMFGLGKGYKELCYGCKGMTKDDEVDHDSLVRCPHCLYQFDPSMSDYYELYGDGEHEISCPECGKDYEMSTYVSYSFRSPPVIKEE